MRRIVGLLAVMVCVPCMMGGTWVSLDGVQPNPPGADGKPQPNSLFAWGRFNSDVGIITGTRVLERHDPVTGTQLMPEWNENGSPPVQQWYCTVIGQCPAGNWDFKARMPWSGQNGRGVVYSSVVNRTINGP
jgi:hypothetical protein